ncbi:MAG: PepSY-like domain-containing protein [Flavobacteriales bacterium]
MKNLFVALLIAVPFAATSCAQDIPQHNVPSVILNAFSTSYPNAADIEWEKKGNTYNVEFEVNAIDHEIWYNTEGKMLKHKTEIPLSDVPAAVTDMLKKDFSEYAIDDIDLLEENGKTFYVVDLDGSPSDRVLHVSPDGKVISNHIDY